MPSLRATRRPSPPQLMLRLVTPMAGRAKAAFTALCVCLAGAVVTLAATPERFVGSFAGAAVRADPFGKSFVVCLEVTERGGTYSLAALMNDTNREPGMNHTSNSHWRWTGSGAIRGSALEFTFSSADTPPEKGSLRTTRSGILLKLGGVQYRLKRASEPCQSDNPPGPGDAADREQARRSRLEFSDRASCRRASRSGLAAADDSLAPAHAHCVLRSTPLRPADSILESR
jgi:hypothetical protein